VAGIGGAPLDAKAALAKVVLGGTLTRDEACRAMSTVLSGEATPAQLGALLAALRVRGETVEEIAGFTLGMRQAALRVPDAEDAIDIVGTGGSRDDPFNISTLASVVVAAAGPKVAKHGNRAASGKCGSADILEALGVRIDLGPEGISHCLAEVGLAFMFAPRFHPSMRHAAQVRREIGIRTVFNILGPLANPAGVRRAVIGVATPTLGGTVAQVLAELGMERALVVHGSDGLDEITPAGPTRTWELRDGEVREGTIEPRMAGLETVSVAEIASGDAAANAAVARAVLGGQRGPHRTVVVLNAAAACVVAGAAADLRAGVALAERSIDSGSAAALLERFVGTTQRLGGEVAA